MYFRPKLISNTLKATAKINVIRNIFDEKYFIPFSKRSGRFDCGDTGTVDCCTSGITAGT
jgi:hypothetical protein